MRQGLYRIKRADGLPNDVRVDHEGIEGPMNEALYRAYGYKPLVDDLPWQDAYRPRQASLPVSC